MAVAFLCVDFAFIHADMRFLSRVAECTELVHRCCIVYCCDPTNYFFPCHGFAVVQGGKEVWNQGCGAIVERVLVFVTPAPALVKVVRLRVARTPGRMATNSQILPCTETYQ